MRSIDVEPVHRRDEAREPREADPRQDPVLQPRDHRLMHTRCALQVSLRPADRGSPSLDGAAKQGAAALDLREPSLAIFRSPRHARTLRGPAHRGPIPPFALAHPNN
jgi:hypothetical protein